MAAADGIGIDRPPEVIMRDRAVRDAIAELELVKISDVAEHLDLPRSRVQQSMRRLALAREIVRVPHTYRWKINPRKKP